MSNKTSKYVNETIVKDTSSTIRDAFRNEIGSYWELGAPDFYAVPASTGQSSSPTIEPQNELTFRNYKFNSDRKVDIEFASETDYISEDETQTLPARSVMLNIYPIDAKFGSTTEGLQDPLDIKEQFRSYVLGAIDDEYEFFEDHHFSITKPLSSAEKVLIEDADPAKSADVDVEFKYNFYKEFYEETVQDPALPEREIENVYNYLFDPLHSDSSGIDLPLDEYLPKKVSMLYKAQDVFDSRENITIPQAESLQYKNVYIPYGHTNTINENSGLSRLWPMGVNVRMKFDTDSMLPKVLNNHLLADSLIRHVAEDPYANTPYRIDEQFYDSEGSLKQEIVKRNIKEINVLRWFENLLIGGVDNLPTDVVFLGDATDSTEVAAGIRVNYHLLTSFIQELGSKIEVKRRSFEDILNGVSAPTEIVAYKISKIDASRPTSDPIQNFWVFNANNEVEIMDFVDTQVKYSKKYLYEISAVKAVYGTAYSYEAPSFVQSSDSPSRSGTKALVRVVTRPTLRLYEIPIYENIGQILENPPVPPMIDIIPYRGVADKLRFHMNGGTGFFMADPIILRNRDEVFYSNYRETNELTDDVPITFKNDDYVSAFEIFRIDYHPTSYEDFKNKLRVRVSTDVNPRSPLKASSATYIETFVPNKKFYYLFRALDVHDQPSLPSIVYRIEMINDGSTIFPIIEAVDFLSDYEIEKRNKMPSRPFRKLLYIAPKFSHSYFNSAKSDMDSATTALSRGEDIYLGGEPESIWGKKYKVRLISKTTGKKIDFNFDVNHKHIETEKERN
jgi:hypothetical protein